MRDAQLSGIHCPAGNSINVVGGAYVGVDLVDRDLVDINEIPG
jgi:hypothetical protein